MAWVIGQKLQGGKYTIDRQLGEGGFGITYRAVNNNGQYVVIKTLNDTVQSHSHFAKFQQDFLNEAIKLAKCRHANIVSIHEVIQEDTLWCIVMEYIDGENLATQVERQGTLSEKEALHYIQQIGEALTVVHNNGLLHRDVKPENIVLRANKSEAVLIDFGIAREFTQNLTQTHTQMLADGFAPVEQYDKRAKRGAYTDVYALAATLYFLLTGEVPTISPLRAIGTLLEEPKTLNSSISNSVNQAILKGMEVKPENRLQSVQQWLELLSIGAVKLFSSQRVDYTKLRDLLAADKWKEADRETSNLILYAARPNKGCLLDSESIKKISCEDLQIINHLWLHYSLGRFGFSVQKRIWEKAEGDVDKFGNCVGWRVDNSWRKY
ncbi:serine/threonine-protein kinase [Scytonema hofmannii]|uniref:serine/threonine-protein kinase n=1 Tax=Scytonema hofmannii TaxID=34078 RepID=UPI00034A5A6C|nr:serine/threonine-protein kinase [Scytonema hofmannii]